ncbi:MAG TPA: diaminopimelate decarboxylase [Terriglobales bacterium]|nr:diaminopimelate decarboxylase [Terriglobales bacterium]
MRARTPLAGRPPGFVYRGGALHADQMSLESLAKRFGTPLYVYSASTIRQRLSSFQKAFKKIPHTVCYSVKANSNLSILRMLARMGCGFDVVSGGELERVLLANRASAKRVVFSGVGKTVNEMELALRAGILMFNVESASELESLTRCASRLKKKARIALRVNPDVPAETHPYISTGLHQHKFGVPIQQARELCRQVKGDEYLQVGGVSVHIGSQITDMAPFAATMERVADLVRDLRSDDYDIEYVDAGGGLGISYEQRDQTPFAERVSDYANALFQPLRKLKVHLLLEPGRSIIGPAGVLLTRVIYRKQNGEKTFLVVDAAMNDLIRPSLYKAYHEIVPEKAARAHPEVVDVVGPVCESGDFFARDRELPKTEEGALLALLDTGAYGMSLASNYNTRPRPAEILVDGRSAKVIRKRETVGDLVALEKK